MPRFKAVNILTLILPINREGMNRIRKLDMIPPDFDDLPLIQERTDKKYTGYLEAHDTVILMIEVQGHREIYEVTCEGDGQDEDCNILCFLMSRVYN